MRHILAQKRTWLELLEVVAKLESVKQMQLLYEFCLMSSDTADNFTNFLMPLPTVWRFPVYLSVGLPGHPMRVQTSN